jgi:hypothetical protein
MPGAVAGSHEGCAARLAVSSGGRAVRLVLEAQFVYNKVKDCRYDTSLIV